jgi:hypothetical protein
MNKFYFQIVHDNSKKNKIKTDTEVRLLAGFNKQLKRVFGAD